MSKAAWQWANRGGGVLILLLASPLLAPQLLAFPYSTEVADHLVYSERPIDPEIDKIVATADAKVARSPIAGSRKPDQPIFLTDGGWRWRWLSLPEGGSFAVTRPWTDAILVNASDIANNRMRNGQTAARNVALSGIVAHEMTHGLIRAHFGLVAAMRFPRELVEGYCDHVAGRSTLTDAEAKRLLETGASHRALIYWSGRKKVEAALQRNGNSVDALFADWGA